jgi:ATP-dependent DNA helicase RecG
MTEEQLQNIISMGEGYQAEFKKSVPSKKREIAEEVCAFANAAGGLVLIGVDDDNTILGVSINNNKRSEIQDALSNITPKLRCNFQDYTLPEGNVFVIEVPSGAQKPYVYGGAIYVRIGPNSQKLSTAEEMREFFQKSDKIFFDEAPCPGFEIPEDVDKKTYDYFIAEAGITPATQLQQVFENLRLLDADDKVKNGAVLFFGAEPEKYFDKAFIRCVAYDGEDKRFIADDKPLYGPLLSQYKNALQWLKGKMNVRYDIEGQGSGPRKEIWEIPETVFKEAVINALAHRDYYEKGATILIEVFDNRVEITNPGGLVSAILPEQFGTKSFSRNPLIFGLFNRMDMVEQVGSGIQRMKNLMEEAELPEPVFYFDGMFSIVLHRLVNWSKKREKFKELLTENQIKIMDLIADNSVITKKVLSSTIGVGSTTIDNNIKKLKDMELLERIGSDKKGKWIIL